MVESVGDFYELMIVFATQPMADFILKNSHFFLSLRTFQTFLPGCKFFFTNFYVETSISDTLSESKI